jgi:hypothetical protein
MGEKHDLRLVLIVVYDKEQRCQCCLLGSESISFKFTSILVIGLEYI